MIVLGLTLLLAAIGAAVMPVWKYSAAWGYGPGACVGALLVCLGILAASGKTGPSDALGERLAALSRSQLMVEASIIDPGSRSIVIIAAE
jgi:hypothetical protein